MRLIVEGVLYENLLENTASYSRGRLIVEGVFYSRKYGINRKGMYSINALMVCGPDHYFYYCKARWPGSVHDSRVLGNSSLYQGLYLFCKIFLLTELLMNNLHDINIPGAARELCIWGRRLNFYAWA